MHIPRDIILVNADVGEVIINEKIVQRKKGNVIVVILSIGSGRVMVGDVVEKKTCRMRRNCCHVLHIHEEEYLNRQARITTNY